MKFKIFLYNSFVNEFTDNSLYKPLKEYKGKDRRYGESQTDSWNLLKEGI